MYIYIFTYIYGHKGNNEKSLFKMILVKFILAYLKKRKVISPLPPQKISYYSFQKCFIIAFMLPQYLQ